MKFVWIALIACVGYSLAEKVRFDGYKLLNIFPETPKQVELISRLQHNPDFDLWSSSYGEDGSKVALSPIAFKKYELAFRLNKIKYEIVKENLQELFDEEAAQMKRDVEEGKNVNAYNRHNVINNLINDLVTANPTLASSYVAGKSSEGRDMQVIVIKTANSRRKIWIDCGIHAREWISPSTCVWMMDKLIDDYKKNDATVRALLDYYEVHILPVVNPDGYEYSHTTSRLWRKNRKRGTGTCVGVDLNRNYPYKWLTGGSSTDPCSDTYAGPSAGSEDETKAVMKAINDRIRTWDAFLTIHSYGKWWFTPYGYNGTIVPPDFDDLDAKAKIGVAAIQSTYGQTGWVTGSSSKILYVASGGSEDWTYETAGIKYSYCLELRPASNAINGFVLQPTEIPLAGQETYNGIKAFLNSIKP